MFVSSSGCVIRSSLTSLITQEPEPEKMQKPTVAKPGKQYGGAGSFIPAGSMPSTMSAGPGGRHNPSRHASTGHMQNNPHSSVLPPSLRASSSMATLDLYVAPYETPAQSFPQGPSPVDQIVGDFAQLDVQSHRHRAESFPVRAFTLSSAPLSSLFFRVRMAARIHREPHHRVFTAIIQPRINLPPPMALPITTMRPYMVTINPLPRQPRVTLIMSLKIIIQD